VDNLILYKSLEAAGMAAISKLQLVGTCGSAGYPYFCSQRLIWGSSAWVKLRLLLKSNEKVESGGTCAWAAAGVHRGAGLLRGNVGLERHDAWRHGAGLEGGAA